MGHVTLRSRRAVLAGVVLAVVTGCGGQASESTDQVAISDPVASDPTTGSELSGLAFDVRRDPG